MLLKLWYKVEAGFYPELIPGSEPSIDSESTRWNSSEEWKFNSRILLNESADDIRNFTPRFEKAKLPSREWYMLDLNNTSLSKVMEFSSRFNVTGRYLFQFPKLEPYTNVDLFVIDPHTVQF